ncbi:GTP pyrophosphokinase [Patulibacter medicamentivorans]|uniref:GTP pyrophosphokinase n=1 Tax=Patulibacter medicamentivorans TaxID=1097667 RepID=H0EAX3_9ACTN|nr:bifunctional (p)ppGpp synthetase/guanosine-3',5'-bis(diphosphate) 3'-pyrophosphohydrolase [Patulibacter medicamentivorans]EHN09191.1 GTP pyrophosphokinase [Patulibacter medicamentivorans]
MAERHDDRPGAVTGTVSVARDADDQRNGGGVPVTDERTRERIGLSAADLAAGHHVPTPPEPADDEAERGPEALTAEELSLRADLHAVIAEHAEPDRSPVDLERVDDAFRFACLHHRDQRRKSGEAFIAHPTEVAKICAGMRLDTDAIVAALLHDTVEDTAAELEEIETRYGSNVRLLVDGVTKLDGIQFTSRDEAQAENYRKMVVAMAADVRVILIKLADRLHNARTLEHHKRPKQLEIAKETLEVYAPIAHRLGIHAIKWELEDLAFATLHPRKYQEIKGLVNQQRGERETYVAKAGEYLGRELEAVGIDAEISGRAKHFYSIYLKMTRKGREFNEIYDLTAMRVVVDSVNDCYGAIGVIHALWKPLPRRFKDFVAMPKANMYQSLHTTVVGPEGRPLEIQIRTNDMQRTAEFGVAAHWMYKESAPERGTATARPGELAAAAGNAKEARSDGDKFSWLRAMLDTSRDNDDPAEFMDDLKVALFEDEVYVFTPKGDVKSLSRGATPVDFAYEVHTDVGHRCVGAKVNGKIVPLSYQLRSGDIVEVLTANRERGPSRDWLSLAQTSRARSKIKAWFKAAGREDSEHQGRELLQEQLRKAGLPAQRIVGSPLLADVIHEMGYKKADDFYIAVGGGKVSPKVVVNKVLKHLKEGEAADDEPAGPVEQLLRPDVARRQPTGTASSYGVTVDGVGDVMLRMAKCCRPVPGDPIVGYVSLGRGITIHRDDCQNAQQLRKDPERFVPVDWAGQHQQSFKVEIQVDGYDRHRLLEDLTRVFAETGVNIVSAVCTTTPPMVRNRFVVEVGDTKVLRSTINRLRNIDAVFDAFRITPSA